MSINYEKINIFKKGWNLKVMTLGTQMDHSISRRCSKNDDIRFNLRLHIFVPTYSNNTDNTAANLFG